MSDFPQDKETFKEFYNLLLVFGHKAGESVYITIFKVKANHSFIIFFFI